LRDNDKIQDLSRSAVVAPEAKIFKPKAINNLGQVLGHGNVDRSSDDLLVLWDPIFGMHRLDKLIVNVSDWYVETPHAINDHGQIVAGGWHKGRDGYLVLLNPVGDR
jgi:hypothetical protein